MSKQEPESGSHRTSSSRAVRSIIAAAILFAVVAINSAGVPKGAVARTEI